LILGAILYFILQLVLQHKRRTMIRYYRVPRFLKIQVVESKDAEKRVEKDWVEVNKDGSPISQKKKEDK